MSSRDDFVAFRRTLGPTRRLSSQLVRARGLDFAVHSSPPVPGSVPLLCINGGLLYDHSLLWPALSPLAKNRQLVFYDQRGRGESSTPPAAKSARIEHDAGDVRALREALGIARWDILGHSWGGGLALLGAEADQEGTRSVVAVCPVGIDASWMQPLYDRALERLTASERAVLQRHPPAMLERDDPAVHSAHSRAIYPAWFADPALASLFSPPRATSVTGAAIAARLRREGYDWRLLLSALRVPVVVIYGERDLLPPDAARELARTLPASRLVAIPGSGHMPFWETPERFFDTVESFLSAPSPDWIPP